MLKRSSFSLIISLRSPRPDKMELYRFIIAVQIVRLCSASKIIAQNDNEHLKTTAANIVNQCFGSSERWSELLIVLDQESHGNLDKIHHRSKTSNSIVFLSAEQNDNGLKHSGKCNGNFNINFEAQKSKTTAVMINTYGVKHLEYVLCFLKKDVQRLWRPRSYFLIVLGSRCDVTECNNMFKVLWDHWILNAVILSPSNEPGNWNQGEIELYTFNPYSADHSMQWETVIEEIVEVSISPGKFNHSWYMFKQRLDGNRPFNCGDLFFDKTFNLNGYVIPISVGYSTFFSEQTSTPRQKWVASERIIFQTLGKLLRFEFGEVHNNHSDRLGQRGFVNGSYVGLRDDIFNGRSHLAPVHMRMMLNPGLELTYPHDSGTACLVSHISGNQPQWTNIVVAKYIWIGLGLSLSFSTVILYLHNKSRGIVSALLNAERLIIGSTIISTSTAVKHRIILGSMFLVVLVIDGAIKGRFISTLTVRRPFPNIETLEQLQEHDVDIYGAEAYSGLIRDPKQKARYHNDILLESCVNNIELGKQPVVCLTDCRYLAYYTANSSIIHKALTPVWTNPLTFLTTRHWPMKNRYNFEVQKLLESGILEKWKSDLARDAEIEGWKQSRASQPPTIKPTKLNDLLPAFLLLLVGLFVALIIFAWEIRDRQYLHCLQL